MHQCLKKKKNGPGHRGEPFFQGPGPIHGPRLQLEVHRVGAEEGFQGHARLLLSSGLVGDSARAFRVAQLALVYMGPWDVRLEPRLWTENDRGTILTVVPETCLNKGLSQPGSSPNRENPQGPLYRVCLRMWNPQEHCFCKCLFGLPFQTSPTHVSTSKHRHINAQPLYEPRSPFVLEQKYWRHSLRSPLSRSRFVRCFVGVSCFFSERMWALQAVVFIWVPFRKRRSEHKAMLYAVPNFRQARITSQSVVNNQR